MSIFVLTKYYTLMKKITLLFTFLIAFGYSTYAQVSAYSFSTNTTGVLDPMTGSTQLIGSGSDDGASAVTPIGFSFTYAGTVYNNFSANSNGLVRLGTTAVTTQWTNSAANANTATPAIFPYWDDLATGSAAGGGKVHYLLTGTAPNQKLIIEWFVTVPRNTTGAANARFQCVLEETTNIVSFVYGTGMVANTGGASIGLATATTVYNTVTASTNTNTTSTFVTNNTGAITSGTSYIFTPPTPCSGSPVAGTVAPATQTLLTGQTPAALVASGYSSGVSGITFQWEESDDDGAADAWANAVGGTGATTASYTPPAYSGTPIYYRLVVTCTNSTMSANTSSVVLTGCSAVTSFIENFDTVTTPSFPGCWAKIGTLGSASTQTTNPNSAPNTLYMYGSSGTAQAVVAMQPVSNLGAGTHRLRFNMRANFTANGVIEFGYLTNPTDATTFVSLGSATAATLTYAEYIITPAAGSYSNFPAFRHSGVPANSLLIDDVKWEVIPACLAPNTLSANAITATSANLSWIDSSGGSQFDYEYVVQAAGTGMPVVAGTPFDISSLPAPSGVLTANTPYEFWVRADCGGSGYSTWAGPYNFTTACATFNTFPFTETFEAASTSRPCWSNSFVTGTSNWTYATGSSGGAITTAFAGTLNARFVSTTGTASPVTKLVSPTFDLTALTAPRLVFQYGQEDWFGDQNELKVYYRISVTDPWVEIGYYTTNVATWTEVILDLPAPSATYQIAFEGINNFGRANVLDNVTIEETPACANPTNLTVTNLTDAAADISWTATTGSYEYVLDMVATDPAGSGTPYASETYNATGLTQSTTYYFHVRTVCAGSTYSTWSTVSFTTLATPPANDECSNAIQVNCGDVVTGDTSIGATDSGSNASADVWYFYNGAAGDITVSLCTNTTFDSYLRIFDSCGGTQLMFNDDSCGTQSTVTFTADGTSTYYIMVEGFGTAEGAFELTTACVLSNDSFDSSAFLAYPNPVKDVLNLEYNSEISSVRVMNLLGQEVISRNINANSTQVDMSQLSAGAYIVNVTVGNAVKTIKVVKQ